MQSLLFESEGMEPLKVLFLGAHSDDIEIGCGGVVAEMLHRDRPLEAYWVVFSAADSREGEARNAARRLLQNTAVTVEIGGLKDGFFPDEWARAKHLIEGVSRRFDPDVIFTHSREDRHQDHRTVSDLTWSAFRDHTILEYEIPKYDGDLGRPNLYVPLSPSARRRKLEVLMSQFPSQRCKPWFTRETFEGLMRIRGVECRAHHGAAEAFTCRKLVLDVRPAPHAEMTFTRTRALLGSVLQADYGGEL